MHAATPLLTALAALAAPQTGVLRPLPPSPLPLPPLSPQPSRVPLRVAAHAPHAGPAGEATAAVADGRARVVEGAWVLRRDGARVGMALAWR